MNSYMYRNNMHYNRHQTCRLLSAGWTPEQVAEEWPRVWRLTRSKLTGQMVLRSRLSERTRITMAGVEEALNR